MTQERNWPNYNAAQTSEKMLAMRLLNEAVRHLEIPWEYQGRGRKPIPIQDMLKCCVIKVFNGFSTRRVTADLQLAWSIGCIDRKPHFNIISKYMRDPAITPWIHELYKTLAYPLVDIEKIFAVDATGFGTFTKAWINHRLSKKEIMDFRKLHVISGVRTNIITDARVSKGKRNDSPYFEGMARRTAERFRMREICADGAYLSRKNCSLAKELGATPYILPKSNTVFNSRGSPAWREMIELWKENEELFREHYHKRSNVESTFSMMKRKFLPYLRSKSPQGMGNELLFKVVSHNLGVLVNAIFMLDVNLELMKIKG